MKFSRKKLLKGCLHAFEVEKLLTQAERVLKTWEPICTSFLSAPVREEAFKICRHILEEVKHQSPIWKKEHYADGKEEWLPGHSLRPKKKIK